MVWNNSSPNDGDGTDYATIRYECVCYQWGSQRYPAKNHIQRNTSLPGGHDCLRSYPRSLSPNCTILTLHHEVGQLLFTQLSELDNLMRKLQVVCNSGLHEA